MNNSKFSISILRSSKLGGKIYPYSLALFPSLPRFYLQFVFIIIHRSGRPAKNTEGLGAFIT